MVPRAIGLGVTQITFVVNTSLATASAPARSSPTTSPSPSSRSRSAWSASRWASCCCRRCRGPWPMGDMGDFAALVERSLRLAAVADAVPDARWASCCAMPTVELLFGGSFPPATLALTAHDAGLVPAGPAGALPQRGPGARLLQRPGHPHAGDRGHPLGGRERGRLASPPSAPWVCRGWPWASRSVAGSRRSILSLILWRRTHAVPLRPDPRGAALVSLVGRAHRGRRSRTWRSQAVESLAGCCGGRLDALRAARRGRPDSLACYLLYSRLVRIPELSQSVRLVRSAIHRG